MTNPTPGMPHVWPKPTPKADDTAMEAVARFISARMLEAAFGGSEIVFEMETLATNATSILVRCTPERVAITWKWDCDLGFLSDQTLMPEGAFLFPTGTAVNNHYALELTSYDSDNSAIYYTVVTQDGRVLQRFGISRQ